MKKVHSKLNKELEEELDKRSISIRTGDEVKVMKGDFKGEEGEIEEINREEGRVRIRGIEKEKADGSKYSYPIHASNLKVTSLSNKEERV